MKDNLNFFTHHLLAKVMSLMIAIVFWFYVTEDKRMIIEQRYEVPLIIVDVTQLEEGQSRSTTQVPEKVIVTLSGKPDRLKQIRPETIEAIVNVTDIKDNNFNQPVQITVPMDTKLIDIEPDRIQGHLDTTESREMPVEIFYNGLQDYKIEPNNVKVSGLGYSLEKADKAVVFLEKNSQIAKVFVVGKDNKILEDLKIIPENVKVITKDYALETKTVPFRLVLSAQWQIISAEFEKNDIELIGTKEALKKIQMVTAYIDPKNGKYTERLKFRLPVNVQALDNINATVETIYNQSEDNSIDLSNQ